MKRYLWFDSWTEEYMEGLPIGNGRLAAMMLGRPERLRIALNHEWMWRGENRFREQPDVSEHLKEVREALLNGDFLKGTTLANEYFGGLGGVSGKKGRVDPYQPAGDIWVEIDAGDVKNYKRSLDLDTGLAKTEFTTKDGQITEQVFVSSIDGCIVAEIDSDYAAEAKVVLSRIEDPRCTITYEKENDGIRMKGSFIDGISFEVQIKIKTDGAWEICDNQICISGAKKTLLLGQIGTDAKGEAPQKEMTFPEKQCFHCLFKRHAEHFATLKGEAVLDVDVEDCDLPTDQRIKLFREGGDPAMPLLYFEYGRYLMVSASSGELPMNLQGKWNEELQPPWEADYHLDINLQMCYWIVDTLGMKHAANTLFNLIERYVPYGKEMAKNLYGCRGIDFCIQTDVWGRVTPEARGWAVWIGAAAWFGAHFFMHWRHTKDIEFLKNRCYPYLKEVAAFYEDYLVEKDGELWIVPSQSPENRFEGTGDWPVSLGYNSAMDVEFAMETFQNVIESAKILGVDADKVEIWEGILKRLPKLSVDSIGRLNEWDQERVEVEPGHRHLSHLYGLFPSQLFEPGSWEWKAAERSLDERLSHGGGHTGWSRSWVGCLMARLGRGEEAWKHFMALIGDFATVSLLDLHPPRIFQIDGNMGGTACVLEMLMQSRRGVLYLLPALPKAWPRGSVRNFKAQDGVTVSFAWDKGKITSFELISTEDQTLKVISGEQEWEVTLKAGERKGIVPMNEMTKTVREYQEKLAMDPHRPRYHFAGPNSNGVPGDSNGAFFVDGVYHLMYLYDQGEGKFAWGHIISEDLLHWTYLPDAIGPIDGDNGCFSGGAFVDEDKTAYLTFWKFPSKDFKEDNGGIAIAYAKPPYIKWERITPIAINGSKEIWGTMDMEIDGEIVHLGCADPSNIWKMNGWYYMQTGNLCVLNAYGRNEDSEERYKGDWTELFRSKDLKNWEFVHRFYKNTHEGPDWPDATEDDMCPSFLPIADKKSGGQMTGKWMQTFIAHNKCGQYYIGELKDETFYPEIHGRFSWKDNTFFAPENLVDDKNRQIAWFWLLDNRDREFERYGWTGVYNFPRCFWLEDGILKMAPVEELDQLQFNEQEFAAGTINGKQAIPVKNGEAFRLKLDIQMKEAGYAGVRLRANADESEYTDLYYDAKTKKLVFDAEHSGNDGRMIKEEAPFELKDGETLSLDIFVDRCVVEIYANERQAICRRVYPTNPKEAVNVSLISDGAEIKEAKAYEMRSTNMY